MYEYHKPQGQKSKNREKPGKIPANGDSLWCDKEPLFSQTPVFFVLNHKCAGSTDMQHELTVKI
ncbi:MAG: hypothetical protein B5M56_03735 [Desulfococcus sp. 4484_241]|nr:MAG: hypothetical protein B5M56_03735 [Desulfococcus sp. 4484_241]